MQKIFHFGLDHLELYGNFQQNLPFHILENEKIHPITENLAIQLIKNVPWYEYKIIFFDTFFTSKPPIFVFYKWTQKGNSPIHTRDYICFYSLSFRLRGEKNIRKIIEKFFHIAPKNPIKRVDICTDIKISMEDFENTLCKIQQKSAIFKWTQWENETIYIGEKKNTKNKRNIIRIYNKIQDLLSDKKSWKLAFYKEYLQYENITRVELEIRRELSKNVSLENIFQKNVQKAIFRNYLEKHTDFFQDFSEEKISLFQKKKKINVFDILPHLEKMRYIQSFLWYAKWMALWMQICPIKILLGSGLCTNETYKELQEKGIDGVVHEINTSKYWQKYIIKCFNNGK